MRTTEALAQIEVFRTKKYRPILVLSYPLIPRRPPDLSEAEEAIVLLLLQGLSNAEIGELRGTAVNTVTNQIADVFRKLRVNTRAELAVKLINECARCENTSCEVCPKFT